MWPRHKERAKTMKMKVRITRVETYYRDVEVEAATADEAVETAKRKEAANEYANLFDLPDDVESEFKVVDGDGWADTDEEDGQQPNQRVGLGR